MYTPQMASVSSKKGQYQLYVSKTYPPSNAKDRAKQVV
jgi:hypothetical protein